MKPPDCLWHGGWSASSAQPVHSAQLRGRGGEGERGRGGDQGERGRGGEGERGRSGGEGERGRGEEGRGELHTELCSEYALTQFVGS